MESKWYVRSCSSISRLERWRARHALESLHRSLTLLKELSVACLQINRSARSEEHTSELQSQSNLVCRLLLEKKKTRHRLTSCAIVSSSWFLTLCRRPPSLHRQRSNSRFNKLLRAVGRGIPTIRYVPSTDYA